MKTRSTTHQPTESAPGTAETLPNETNPRRRSTLSSLQHRNFRLYLTGQALSLTGTWLQTIATSWLILTLTGSGTLVGALVAAQFLPVLLLGAWGGVLADRAPKRKILLLTQTWYALLALTLGTLAVTGNATAPLVLALAFLQGVATAVEMPTRQAFVAEMVPPEELQNAVALNSATFNTARLVGPATAGLIIATVGTWACFYINSASFLFVLLALKKMRTEELRPSEVTSRARGQIREGIRYAWHTPQLRRTLILVAVTGTFTFNYGVTLPLLAKDAYDAGPGAFGLLTTALGGGALLGALWSARRGTPTPQFLQGACAAFGASTLLAASMPNLELALLTLPLVGAASIAFASSANTTLQLNSAPHLRGRVMALYSLLFLGSTPIGGPLVGWISETQGAQAGLAAGGAAALLAAAHAAGARRRRNEAEETQAAEAQAAEKTTTGDRAATRAPMPTGTPAAEPAAA